MPNNLEGTEGMFFLTAVVSHTFTFNMGGGRFPEKLSRSGGEAIVKSCATTSCHTTSHPDEDIEQIWEVCPALQQQMKPGKDRNAIQK
jgi:hypothetical protein